MSRHSRTRRRRLPRGRHRVERRTRPHAPSLEAVSQRKPGAAPACGLLARRMCCSQEARIHSKHACAQRDCMVLQLADKALLRPAPDCRLAAALAAVRPVHHDICHADVRPDVQIKRRPSAGAAHSSHLGSGPLRGHLRGALQDELPDVLHPCAGRVSASRRVHHVFVGTGGEAWLQSPRQPRHGHDGQQQGVGRTAAGAPEGSPPARAAAAACPAWSA